MKFIAIIPARYASTRFPGKPLAVLGGKTVIQRVYEQVSSVLNEVYVATDDERIFSCVESFGGKAVMTRSDHKSGTDRIQEAVEKIGTQADVIINVQGDEPFIQPSQVETLMHLFDDPTTQIGTLGKRFDSLEAIQNPNSPKIVTDIRGFALNIWAFMPIVVKCWQRLPNCRKAVWRRQRALSSYAGWRTATASASD